MSIFIESKYGLTSFVIMNDITINVHIHQKLIVFSCQCIVTVFHSVRKSRITHIPWMHLFV